MADPLETHAKRAEESPTKWALQMIREDAERPLRAEIARLRSVMRGAANVADPNVCTMILRTPGKDAADILREAVKESERILLTPRAKENASHG